MKQDTAILDRKGRDARLAARRAEYYARGREHWSEDGTCWLVGPARERIRRAPEKSSWAPGFSLYYDPIWLQPGRVARLERLVWQLDKRRERFWDRHTAAAYEMLREGPADWVSPRSGVQRWVLENGRITWGWSDSEPQNREAGAFLRWLYVEGGPDVNGFVMLVGEVLDNSLQKECARRWPTASIRDHLIARLLVNDRPYFYHGVRTGSDENAVRWSRLEWPLFGGFASAVVEET